MTAPEPSDDELAARLIRAGMRETPGRGTLQRTLAAVGLGASALGTASSAGALAATKTAVSMTAFAVVKWAGVGAAAGVLVAASAHGVYRMTRPATPPTGSAVTALDALRTPEHATSAGPVEPLPGGTSSARLVPAPPPRPARSAPDSAETEAPLAAELAFVDGGREAFQHGSSAAALARLEGYERLFPEQRLLPEVLYLRMQALHRQGETRRAAELAERLVRDFPQNPHASSARGILDGKAER